MEKIVLFSRCDLVHLYGRLNKYLSCSYEIIHLAYSNKEERILVEDYNVNDVINFKTEIFELYQKETVDYDLCCSIDKLIIEQSNGRFCLNSAIQSDRTFQHLSYDECLVLSQVYYKFWNDLIISKNVKFLLHEPTALFFTHIASIICKKHKAQYLTQIQAIGENMYNWIFIEGDNGFSVELQENLKKDEFLSQENIFRVKTFLEKFRSETEILMPELYKQNENSENKNLTKFIGKNIRLIARHIKNHFFVRKQYSLNPSDHVEIYSMNSRPSLIEEYRKNWDNYFYKKFDSFNPDMDFYYYPMHLEPEAVVLYWGDGIYKNQVNLIENIAGQLPPNCFLYVKDHPHGGSYRNFIDYQRICAIPNVKLLNPKISGRIVITKSRGVITINGTSGFEAVLMNKQVYMFGNIFSDLSNRVVKINNIRDLRKILYSNYLKTFQDDNDLFKFVTAYLKSIHDGFTNYFVNRAVLLKIDDEKNAKILAKGMLSYFDKQ